LHADDTVPPGVHRADHPAERGDRRLPRRARGHRLHHLPAGRHRPGHLRLRGRGTARLRQAVRAARAVRALPQAGRGRPLLPGAPGRCRGPRRLARAAGPQRLGADHARRRPPRRVRYDPGRRVRRDPRGRSRVTSTLPAATAPKVPAQRRPAPAAGPTGRAVPPDRLRSSRSDLLLCGVLLVAILLVQGWNISAYPTLSDDEGTYLAQAWAVQEGRGLAHYTYWYDHPPLGWIQLAVLTWIPAMLSPESMTVGTMRAVMLLISG